jgi:exopolysaccharide production protein ExoY
MNLIIFALLGMLGVFGAVFSKLLADEFKAWAPSLVAHIIAAAVRKLPDAKRERFSEEWKSHVNEVPGDISKIAAACGCLSAAWKIAEAGPLDARKRALDLAFATCALMGLIPLFFILLLVVAASSPGPILSRQTRIGRNGKSFQALKFRTMHIDADNRLREYLASNPEAVTEWKVTRRLRFDPRVTAIGSYLRKCSLDELPQLYNILVGDMSLVGPRSLTEGDFGKQTEPDDDYTACRPGLTGFWQFDRHSKNTAYTRNWSPMLDVKIMLATIAAVLRDDGLEQNNFEENYRIGLGIVLSVLALLGAGIIGTIIWQIFGLS